jgi:hypothetical protein
MAQTAIQPWGIVALPAALLVTLPFPRVLAFFQNVTLLGDGKDRELRTVVRKAWHQSALWPMQNVLLVWLGSPFLVVPGALLLFAVVPAVATYMSEVPLLGLLLPAGFVMIALSPLAMVVALNIGLSMFFAPHLFRVLFGIETALTRSNAWAKNDAFFLVLCCLVYLCLDPLLKACYCLRCFYGASIETGDDLKVELKGLKRAGAAVLVFFIVFLGAGAPCQASPGSSVRPLSGTPISAPELDAALDHTIRLPRYDWRMPREKPPESAPRNGALRAFLAPLVKGLKAIWSFLGGAVSKVVTFVLDLLTRVVLQPSQEEKAGGRWTSLSKALIVAPLACLVALFAFLGWKMWKGRKTAAGTGRIEIQAVPDITREDVDASALPEDGWMEMGKAMMERGELRYALRAMHMSTLALLARERLITLERHKSDREYERELRRRPAVDAHLLPFFAENRGLFEKTWYGLHEATPGVLEQFMRNQEGIRRHAQP